MIVWLVIALVLVVLMIDRIVLAYGFHDLRYQIKLEVPRVEIDQPIPVSVVVENQKLIGIPFLKVTEHFPENFSLGTYRYTVFIMPFQRVKRAYQVQVCARGLYKLKETTLELGDFTGLNSREMTFINQQEIIVLPRPVELSEVLTPYGALSGDISVKRWILEDPLVTVGIREYSGNEPQRYIHWPSSARSGQLMVRNFDFTTDSRAMVVLNIETMKPCALPFESELIEMSISICRGILEEFEDSRIPYGFASNALNMEDGEERGYFNSPSLGAYHLETQIDILGRAVYNGALLFDRKLKALIKRQGDYSTAVIITPRILDIYLEPLEALGRVVQNLIIITTEPEFVIFPGADRVKVLQYSVKT